MSCNTAKFQDVNCQATTLRLGEIETPGNARVRLTHSTSNKTWWLPGGDSAEVSIDVSALSFDKGIIYYFEIFAPGNTLESGAVDFAPADIGATTYDYNRGAFRFIGVEETVGAEAPTTALLTLRP